MTPVVRTLCSLLVSVLVVGAFGVGCGGEEASQPRFPEASAGQGGRGGTGGEADDPVAGPRDPVESGGTAGTGGGGNRIDVSDCKPGTYAGEFRCEFDMIDDFVVDGPISITLEQDQMGEFIFSVTDGKLEATAIVFFGFRADILGGLDCYDGELSAVTENGIWAVGDPDMPLLPGGTVDVMLNGELDPVTQTITGPFVLDDPELNAMLGTCHGSWTITHVP